MQNNHPALPPGADSAGPAYSRAREEADIEKGYAEFLRWLWAAKGFLLTGAAAGIVLALMIGALQTPLYKLHSSLEVQEMNDKFTDPNPSSDKSEPSLRALSDVQTEIRILTSRTLVERTISKMPEAERVRLLDVPRFGWMKAAYDQSIDSVVKRLDAHSAAGARIIDVTFMCQDAPAGAAFVNGLAQELTDYSLESRWKTSQRTQAWLERELDDFRQKLEQSEREAEAYARAPGVAQTQPDASTQPSVKPDIAVAAAVSRDPQLRALRQQQNELAKQASELEAIYSAQSESVVKLREQVAAVRSSYAKRRAIVMAQARQLALQAPSPATEEDAKPGNQIRGDDADKRAHYSALQREVEANRQLFDAVTARVKEASVASAMRASNILVLDPAHPPAKAATPNQWLNGLAGVVGGFSVALVYACLKNLFAGTFSGPPSVRRYLGIPLLGSVPSGQRMEPGRVLHLAFDEGSQTAEAYRGIRSSILHLLGQHKLPWRLLFISAGPHEGKTTVIGNLGAALAASQRKVLLVDGDLRHPTLHEVFGMENENGLIEFLGKQLPASAADSHELIRATQIPGLYLMSAGRPGVNAPEILASDHLPQVMRDLVKGFDLVLLDSPPLLPYSEARSLARMADGAVVVVRANSTRRQAAHRACALLAQDGTHIAGAILTDWNADPDTTRFQTGYREAV